VDAITRDLVLSAGDCVGRCTRGLVSCGRLRRAAVRCCAALLAICWVEVWGLGTLGTGCSATLGTGCSVARGTSGSATLGTSCSLFNLFSTRWTNVWSCFKFWLDVLFTFPMSADLQLANAFMSLSVCKRVGLVMFLCLN